MIEVDDNEQEKQPAKIPRKLILGVGIEVWLVAAGVLLAIPYVNLVALPVILLFFAGALLLYFWHLRRSY
jgi:hypothetical protein